VFTNDFSLTPTEARKLIQWIDDGAVKGEGEPDPLANFSAPTNYPFAWPASLGQPAAVLHISAQSIPASGVVDYRYINVTNTAFSSNVWLRAAVVRPSNTRVVHHSLVFDGSTVGMGLDGFFRRLRSRRGRHGFSSQHRQAADRRAGAAISDALHHHRQQPNRPDGNRLVCSARAADLCAANQVGG